jgi:hypothetical protein
MIKEPYKEDTTLVTVINTGKKNSKGSPYQFSFADVGLVPFIGNNVSMSLYNIKENTKAPSTTAINSYDMKPNMPILKHPVDTSYGTVKVYTL